MARKGRHPRRKGPGGPRRTTRQGPADVVPITAAPGARHREGLLGPSVDSLVRALLSSVRTVAPRDDPARPLAIEVWADRMAATVYGPEQMPADFYADLADRLRTSEDPDALAALAALAHVLDHRDAAPLRRAHADDRADRAPDDRTDLGIGRASVARCLEVSHPQGDGVSLVLEVDQPGAPHTVATYVDLISGGLAKDLVLGPPGATRAAAADDAGLTVREVSPAEVRARIEEALDLTDHTVDPPVASDLDDVRAVVERRLGLLPTGGAAPEPHVLEPEEIEELVDTFLASPEADTLDEGERDEAAWLLDPWLSHATGHAVGDPLRISPMLIEVFCLDWYPRKVIGDPATTGAAPAVLRAWTHHVARLTGLEDRWRDEALAAVDTYAPALAGAGPSLGMGGGLHDEVDADLVALVGEGGEEGDDDSPLLDPFTGRADDATGWRPLQAPAGDPRRAPWQDHPTDVADHLRPKVQAICAQVAVAADRLLGRAFVQPAVDLALRIGALDPSPLPHTRDATWSSAVVWLLAEDAGALDPDAPGRAPADLDAALPTGRSTTTARAAEVRDRLGLSPGDLAITW